MTSIPSSPTAVSPSDRVVGLVMGGFASQVTFVLARLGVADQLAGGPRHADAVAETVGADPGAFLRLLRAAATLGLLVEGQPDQFRLTALGECLRADSPNSVRERVLAYSEPVFWRLIGGLAECVRTGRSTAPEVLGGTLWDYYAEHPDAAQQFSRAMGEQQTSATTDVAKALDASGFRRIVDVGGANGELLTAVLERAPQATGVLFDLPHVIDGVRRQIAGSATGDRIGLVDGDFFVEVPQADLYLLIRILHDWDDDRARHILATCRRAAEPDARLVVVEMVVPQPWAPSMVHIFDLAMLVLLGGRERTESEFRAPLGGAGWKLQDVIPTASPFSVLQAVAG